jgi:hypothetical protein
MSPNRLDRSGFNPESHRKDEGYRMFQHPQMSRLRQPLRNRGLHAGNNRSWLSILLATFEKTSQTDLRAVPCDDRVLAAFEAQLARPAPPRGCRESNARLLH